LNILKIVGLFSLMTSSINYAQSMTKTDLHKSHDSTVKIFSPSGGVSGSGSMISNDRVLTCFHVVSKLEAAQGGVRWQIYQDLQVTLPSGEIVSGTVVSLPSQASAEPLQYDFAILKLSHPPLKAFSKVSLAAESEFPELGDDVVYSGFPLSTPGMVTHRGMVSGSDDTKNLIFVQGSINKGNSGGGLINSRGDLIGIVSLREGGITQELEQLRAYISKQQGGVALMGVDQNRALNALIDTLDRYISTGIGYARSIRFAREYIARHPEMMR
jgi:hypothetical protein